MKETNLLYSIDRKFKGYARKICKRIVRKCVFKDTRRDVIILVDSLAEVEAIPMDTFTFFEYLKNLPDCKFDAYYIMRKESPDAKKLKKKYGNSIIFYEKGVTLSFFFKLCKVLTKARFLCESFQALKCTELDINEAIKESPYVESIFTQHGVNFFKDTFIRPNVYGKKMFDKVMISNEIEKELFIRRGEYQESDIIPNGLFRWDRIENRKNNSKDIFIYFTHRFYLSDIENKEESVYIKTVRGLLENEKFLRMVKEYGLNLKVGMHHSLLSKFGHDFFKNITIVNEDDIERVKQEAKIFITDYSSMCFEIMLQNKPVIFYRIPDAEDCEKYNYKSDMANPYSRKENYIYNVVNSIDEFFVLFKEYVDCDFIISKEEQKKNNKFFYYRKNFCQRFYEALCTLDKEKKANLIKRMSGKKDIKNVRKFSEEQMEGFYYLLFETNISIKQFFICRVLNQSSPFTRGEEYVRALKILLKEVDDSVIRKSKIEKYRKEMFFVLKYGEKQDFISRREKLRSLNVLLSEMGDIFFVEFIQKVVALKGANEDTVRALTLVLSGLSDHIITRLELKKYEQAFLMALKHKENRPDLLLSAPNKSINLDFINLATNKLIIEGDIQYYPYVDSDDFKLGVLVNGEMLSVVETQQIVRKTFLGNEVVSARRFYCEILLQNDKDYRIGFAITKENGRFPANVTNIKYRRFTMFSEKYVNGYYAKDGWVMTRLSGNIELTRRNICLKDELRLGKELWRKNGCGERKAVFVRFLCYIVRKIKNKRVWIFVDKPGDANDNAEMLLDYILENSPDLKHNKYYFVINKNSKDYTRLKEKYNVVPLNSYRYKFLFLTADLLVATCLYENVVNPFQDYNAPYRDLTKDMKRIFLNYNVGIRDDMRTMNRYIKNIDLFICSSKKEAQQVLGTELCYKQEQVAVTGLCRFDNYKYSQKGYNVITFALTESIPSKISNEQFVKSKYFKAYNSLLTSKRLLKILKEKKLTFYFVASKSLVPYLKNFKSTRWIIILKSEVARKNIIERSKLLITDSSTEWLEYTYLNKPIMYSKLTGDCLDSEDYFGEIEYTVEGTVDRIIEYVNNNFQTKKKYYRKMNEFFKYHDRNNCKRVLAAIQDRIL